MKTDSDILDGSISCNIEPGDNVDEEGEDKKQQEEIPDNENAAFLYRTLKKQKKLVLTRWDRKEQYVKALQWLHHNKEQLHIKKNYGIPGIGGVSGKPGIRK